MKPLIFLVLSLIVVGGAGCLPESPREEFEKRIEAIQKEEQARAEWKKSAIAIPYKDDSQAQSTDDCSFWGKNCKKYLTDHEALLLIVDHLQLKYVPEVSEVIKEHLTK